MRDCDANSFQLKGMGLYFTFPLWDVDLEMDGDDDDGACKEDACDGNDDADHD